MSLFVDFSMLKFRYEIQQQLLKFEIKRYYLQIKSSCFIQNMLNEVLSGKAQYSYSN